jgi:hypothetical protein
MAATAAAAAVAAAVERAAQTDAPSHPSQVGLRQRPTSQGYPLMQPPLPVIMRAVTPLITACVTHACAAHSRHYRAHAARALHASLTPLPTPTPTPTPNLTGRPWAWLVRLAERLTPHQPLRLLFNIGALFLIMRFWPSPSGRGPFSAEAVTVQIAFSEFVKQVQTGVRAPGGAGAWGRSRWAASSAQTPTAHTPPHMLTSPPGISPCCALIHVHARVSP